MTDHLAEVAASTRRYRRTEKAHEEARAEVVARVVAALRAGEQPTRVAEASPFTASYVRKLAREHGIEPAAPGPKTAAPASTDGP